MRNALAQAARAGFSTALKAASFIESTTTILYNQIITLAIWNLWLLRIFILCNDFFDIFLIPGHSLFGKMRCVMHASPSPSCASDKTSLIVTNIITGLLCVFLNNIINKKSIFMSFSSCYALMDLWIYIWIMDLALELH